MSKLAIFMADGCEEIEALTVVDMVRRAGIEIEMISLTEEYMVEGAHDIAILADVLKSEAYMEDYDGVILPGGMPGTKNLAKDELVVETIRTYAKEKKMIAAICAAPSVLGENELLVGKCATCYPGFESKLKEARFVEEPVVVDGNVITGRGMGTAIDFALAIVEYMTDKDTSTMLAKTICYKE